MIRTREGRWAGARFLACSTGRPHAIAGHARIAAEKFGFAGMILRPDGSEAHRKRRATGVRRRGEARRRCQDGSEEPGAPDFFTAG